MNNSHTRIRFFLLLMLVMSLALAACGGGEEASPPTEPPPTNTPVPPPTATPVPTSTPEPTATPDPTAGFQTFDAPDAGVTVLYPEGWFAESLFGFLIFGSDEELMDGPEPGEEGGVVLLIAGDTSEFETTDPAEAITEFGLAEEIEVVSGPENITVNGLEGTKLRIHATSENDTPLSVLVAILMGGERSALFFGVTPQESEAEFLPIFEAMLGSVTLREPVAVGPGGSAVDVTFPEGFLTFGELAEGSLTEAGETAVWSFSGAQGDLVSVTVTPLDDDFDLTVDVLDGDGFSIIGGVQDSSFGAETVSDILLPNTGQYFIAVSGYADNTGAYQILLQSGMEAYPASGNIAVGETVLSTVTANAVAEWTFTAAANDVVAITVTPLGDLDAVVDVINAAGASILPDGEVDGSFGEERLPAVTIPAAGRYTIVVRGFAGGTGSFSLALRPASASAVPSGEVLAYGQPGNGTLADAAPQTWSFFAAAGDVVDVTVIPLQDDFDVVVDVLDGFGFSVLPDGEQDQSYNTEYVRVIFLEEEGYYNVAVRGYDGSTGDYVVLVDESLDGLPGSIVFASDTLGEGEEHLFPFTGGAGEVVRIYVWPDFGHDVVVSLYNDDTGELITEVDSYTGFEELVFTIPELANYYFQIAGFEGSTGYYEVAIVASGVVFVELAGGDEVYGRFGEEGLLEYFISVAAGDTLTISASSDPDTDLTITISDLDDNVLAEIDASFSGEDETLTYTFTEDVLAVITIADFFGGQGDFFMNVSFE